LKKLNTSISNALNAKIFIKIYYLKSLKNVLRVLVNISTFLPPGHLNTFDIFARVLYLLDIIIYCTNKKKIFWASKFRRLSSIEPELFAPQGSDPVYIYLALFGFGPME